MTIQQDPKAWPEGYQAVLAGPAATDFPHPAGGELALSWNSGFVERQAKTEQAMPGTKEALALGCRCPLLGNDDMRGPGRYTYSGGCPVNRHIVERMMATRRAGRS